VENKLDIVILGQELIKLHAEHPHQRFLQLLYNILIEEYGTANLDDGKLYNLKDSELLEVIKKENYNVYCN
jgi:hypothetical protein